jgi:hypothetical protein
MNENLSIKTLDHFEQKTESLNALEQKASDHFLSIQK